MTAPPALVSAAPVPPTTASASAAPASALAPSPRLALALLARAAALRTPGVVSLPATAYVTEEHGERVGGVRVIAEGDGRYEVAVALAAAPVPLHALAQQVREQVRHAATAAGLAARLGTIAVAIVDVVDRADAAEPAR